MKVIWNILKYICLTLLIILASMFIWVFVQTKVRPDKIPSIFGYKPFIVLSGSMESELYRGDLAIVKDVDKNSLQKQDIIAFRDEDNHVVTHRIIDIVESNGVKKFITKGDNNNTKDSGSVDLDKIEGKYIGKWDKFGNVFLTLQKPSTLIIMIVLIILIGIIWISIGNGKLSKEERKELEMLRKEKTKED